MGYGLTIEISGALAAFNRAEMKTERVSYDCITPSAARGILDSVLWHPGLCWKIDRIHVINPIKFTGLRRNEVLGVASAPQMLAMAKGGEAPYIVASDKIIQRSALLLVDVRYVVEAHFEMTNQAGEHDTPEKFYSMARRRLLKGQAYSQPYLGCREFPANVRLLEESETIPTSCYDGQTKDLGFMLYDLDYSDPQNLMPMFFRAQMVNGVIDLADCEVFR